MKKKLVSMITALLCTALLIGCAGAMKDSGAAPEGYPYYDGFISGEYGDGNYFDEIVENPFTDCTEENKTASVSLTVNTAAFPILRRYLQENRTIPKNAVKIEEVINYFEYGYDRPTGDEVVALSGAVIDTPWNENTKLVIAGVQATTAKVQDVKNNVVFLVDVSGSMTGRDRLELAKESFKAYAETLDENDIVSIVTYASGTQVVLDGARGNETNRINKAIGDLKAGGATNGAGGIDLAYQTAFKYQEECDNSVIVIATDGDFNIGASTPAALKEQISENRRRGVYLSALGFGFDNLSDMNMQEIVASGQGAYAYIDSLDAAREALTQNGGVLYVVGEEAKAQIEFNPSVVSRFRLIGFENKMITDEEFDNPDTPAGALGSDTQVTAVFEVELKEGAEGDIGDFTVAYHERGGADEKKRTLKVAQNLSSVSRSDSSFISAVVEACLLMRNSEYKGAASYESVIQRLDGLNISQSDKKYEFVDFIKKLTEEG